MGFFNLRLGLDRAENIITGSEEGMQLHPWPVSPDVWNQNGTKQILKDQ